MLVSIARHILVQSVYRCVCLTKVSLKVTKLTSKVTKNITLQVKVSLSQFGPHNSVIWQ